MLKPSPLKHKEDGHALLSEEAHTEAHAEENVPDNFFSQPNPMNLDRPQTNILVPEINPNTPLSSADFYNKDKSDKESKDPLLEVGKEKVDSTINPQTGEKWTREQAVANMKSKGEKGATFKPEDKVASETELLKAWLNTEYFGKGVAQKAIGNNNLTAYQKNNPGEDALRKDFKSNLGRLETGREAFPSLTDSNLDNIFGEVFDSKVRNEKGVISKASQYTAINDGLEKKVSIAENINNLSQLKIKTNESRAEAEYADAVEQLRALGPLKEGEEKSQGQIVLERSMDINTPGSLADRAFNKDEYKMNYGIGADANTKKMGMYKTGKRIPKDVGYKRFHDPSSGKNINEKEARAVRDNGGTTSDITDAYETYLGTYENTSQADLAKYNDQVLLEEAGYNIEGKKTADYYVGDKIMRNMLAKQGYKTDKENPDIFKDVPLSVMTNLSHVPGKSNFWSPNTSYAKGEVIPQSFEGMPYENEEEFHDHLRVRRNQGNNIAAKNAALWETYYLNRDPSTIEKSRLTQFSGAFANSMFGEQITDEQWDQSGQDIVDTIDRQIVPDSGVDVSLEQEKSFKRTFMDKAVEGGGGLAAMLATLTPINKLDKALRISKSIMALSAPRYINSAGKVVKQSQAITKAAKQGKNLDDWAKTAGYTMVKASPLQKGIGLATLGIYEDIKMREVLGGMTDGRMEFERGVGFGFALGPKLLPFGFGRFAKGKKYNLGSKSTQMNTFLQSTFVNGGSFALAVESGDLIGAVVKDLQGKKEFETWAHHHWGDRDENMSRIGLNIITGKALGLKNFDYMDFKTTERIGQFNVQSIELATKDVGRLAKLAKANKMYDKNGNPDVERFIAENQNHKDVENYRKHLEDFQMASERLNLIDQTKKWTGNAAEVGKTYEDHYKPLVDMFKAKGKKVNIVITDKPVMQDVVLPSGEVVKQEVNALYTRMKDSKDGTATIQINTKKSKGKRTANHEAIHAYVDLMFDGNIKLKENFTKSLKQALVGIKTPNGNLHKDIMEANDINKMDKLEEMMAYGAEHMGKAENAKLGSAFPGMKKFWNKFAKSTLGLEADVTTKQDVINLMKTLGNTGNLNKLERLSEIIQTDPTGTAREGQVASAEINKAIDRLDVKKAKVLEEMNDLKTAQGNSTKFQKEVDAKRDLFNEYNESQKILKKESEITTVVEKSAKDGDIMSQVDKNYTIGKYKDMVVDGKTIPAKQVFQDQQKNMGNRSVAENIRTSSGLESMIRNQATLMKVPQQYQPKFVKDVKDRIIDKFLKEYDPGKINKEFGRELTPFGWLTTRPGGRPNIMYRAAGDIAAKFKKEVPTVSADAQKGGFEAFIGFSEQTGYMNTSKMFESEVQREGIELSESPGMKKVVGTKVVEGETVDITLGEKIDQKSGADAKNLDFEAKGAKDIVSYKNIKSNAEKTIGKEVAVDYYGMSLETHNKTLKNESQTLNNPDIENILKVIKENIGGEIKMMPRWKQSIIDKISGEEVAFDIVGGKFPSEPKATGTTTSVLKLKDKNGNGLLYKEIQQTGTKGSKYEYSDRLLEYHEKLNPDANVRFEQDIVEALGSGNRAEISGKLKGWVMQRKKAMYVQGVDKALPNTPELTAKFILAEMINQLTAGKAPGLASRGDLMNEIQRSLNKFAEKEINFNPSVNSFHTLFTDKQYAKYVKNGDAKKFLDKWAKVHELTQNFEKSIEVQAEVMAEGMAGKTTKEVKAIEAKNAKEAATILKEFKRFKDIDVSEGLYDWSMNATKVAAQNKFELALANKYPKSVLDNIKTNFMSTFGQGKGQRWSFVNERYERMNHDVNNPTSEGFFKAHFKGDFVGSKAELPFIKDVKILSDMGASKTNLAKLIATGGPKLNETIWEAGRKEYAGKNGDYKTTLDANVKLREFHLNGIRDIIINPKKYGLTQAEASQAAFRHLRQQTNASNGIIKGTATVTSMSMKAGTPLEKAIGQKNYLGTMFHAEHQMQLLNHTLSFLKSVAKNGKNKDKFQAELKDLSGLFEQSFAIKQDQLKYDSPLFGGNTTYLKAFKNKNLGEVSSILNIMYRPGVASEMVNLKSDIKGETIGETILREYSQKQLDILLKESIKVGEPNALYYNLKSKNFNREGVKKQNLKALENAGISAKHVASKNINKAIKAVDKALELGRGKNKKARGMSTFDFDETVGISNNFVIATKGGKTKKIASNEWPFVGDKMIEEGWKMDFTDFNKVTDGKPGPLMQKMKNQIKKFGPENVFILTARANESAPAIHEYLKSEGIEIPLKNITGLGNSTGEAKAMWMLEKFAEGYNDMYFVDDAMPNVKAVRDVLSQLDIKSKVQQALASRDLNKSVNDIMEHSFGIESKKVFSTAEGKVRGKDKKRRKFMMTDSASDLELLMEPMYGKGKKGIENKKWFEENFYKPWERGINSLNTARQTILNDYMGLRKQNKDIVKSLDKPVEGTNFTTDQAARVYIWNKAGFEVPGLTKTSKAKLLEHVANNPKLQAYAESVARLTKIETGLRQPKETWWAETIATEVQQTGTTVGREKYIGEWLDVKNEIFTKENMAKMESELGPKWREATENMFERMETGKTRNRDLGRIGNEVMNYLNGSVGAIMNLNTRSATLQLISSVNFINHAENNPLKAGLAFANQPQYWKDFMTIMNSDMLKQRRDGLKINVTEAELAAAVYGKGSKAKKALAWILKQGYIPTKIADSFAISSGGATYYRNRAKMYQKQGLSLKEAEAKAFIDFAGVAEKTQQSSRPDLLSQQQTSFEGRLLLPFANTPMQMNRIMVKEMLDIGKGRYKGSFGQDSFTNKMSKVAYYGAIQSAIFAGLQTGLFALMTNSDDDEIIANKKVKAYNTMADSFLRGMGIPGVVASGVKNAGMAFFKQNEKGFNADYSEIGEALLNMSPTIGSKFSKLDQAGNTYNYNKREILEKGFSLDNTYGIEAAATTIEALTNVPIARVLRKTENIKGALDDRNENWQRGMNGLGWSGWDVQSNVFQIEKAEKKEERDVASKTRAKVKKEIKKKETIEANKAVIEENKKKSKRDGICSAISKGGKRCKSKAVGGGMCTVHEKATQNITGVKSQCKKIKSGGKRCGMKTSAKSGFCYYHD